MMGWLWYKREGLRCHVNGLEDVEFIGVEALERFLETSMLVLICELRALMVQPPHIVHDRHLVRGMGCMHW